MSRFCSSCGKELEDSARFCRFCGEKFEETEAAPPEVTQPGTADGAEESLIYCPECGGELRPGAVFCPKCRAKVGESFEERKPLAAVCPSCGNDLRPGARFCSRCRKAVTEEDAGARDEDQSPFAGLKRVAGIAGDVSAAAPDLSIELPQLGDLEPAGQVTAILSPVRTVISSAQGFIGKIKSFPRNKRAIISAIVMLWLWIVFMLWNQSGSANKLSGFGSWLTFAEGGLRGSVAQRIGGIFGKCLVMTGFMSLFSGKREGLVRGARQMFTKGIDPGLAVTGAGAAMLMYRLFAGYTGAYGSMVAVFGAILSLEALGGAAGFIKSFAASIVSKKADNGRVLDGVGFKSLLTGLTGGFVIAAAVSALRLTALLPGMILGAGIVITIAEKIVKSRKGAGADEKAG